jgi:hypothetical protein
MTELEQRADNEARHAHRELVEELEAKLAREELRNDALEQLRPVWAQGWTKDSMAAQASGNALSQLWKMLGVQDQTQAADRIEELEAKLAEALECNEEFSMDNKYLKKRAEVAEAKLAKAVDVIDWALICWDDHNTHGYMMQGDWVLDARTTLAELKRSER